MRRCDLYGVSGKNLLSVKQVNLPQLSKGDVLIEAQAIVPLLLGHVAPLLPASISNRSCNQDTDIKASQGLLKMWELIRTGKDGCQHRYVPCWLESHE